MVAMNQSIVDSLRSIAVGPIGTVARAELYSRALGQIAGSDIPVEYRGDVAILRPSPEQARRIADWTVRQLRREPGPVQVDFSAVWPRVVLRAWWPWILGAMGVSFAIGAASGGIWRR